MATHKPIKSLVVDTGPLIKNTISISTIIQSAEHIYTTPAIISEIRDPATRSRVETTLLPFLNVKTASPASHDVVAQFSKKTGDFPVLSRQDLGILALAYELDQEHKEAEDNSHEYLEQAPEEERSTKMHSAAAPNDDTSEKKLPSSTTEAIKPTATDSIDPEVKPNSELSEARVDTLEEVTAKLDISGDATSDPDDDSDGDWITPSNLKQHQAEDNGVFLQETSATQINVATMTTDYAMQNVLLQMRLTLVSASIHRIQNLRTYVLRCHACFLTTKEMTKQFCPRCGQPTLNRVSCTTNAKGEFKIHLSKNHQWNNRGNKYSVPKPVPGTASGKGAKGGGKSGWGRDLILAEDQKEYIRQVGEEKRSKTRDLMDEDYLPRILTGDRGRAGGRPKVGAGKNVNSRKRF